MANHGSVSAWRIPEIEEPGRLPFVRSHRVRHNRRDLAAAAAAYLKRMVQTKTKTPLAEMFKDVSQGCKNYSMGKAVYETRHVDKTEYPPAKELTWNIILHYRQKRTQNGSKT